MSKVSIIVPVYNKAKYLKDCLKSLVGQTLKDIEIICVDDGSTDNSPGILREFADRDNRITVIWQKDNQGVSVARNIGIRRASGEFLAFVDADDFVDGDFYERLYSVSCGYDCVKGEIWDYDTEINSCTLNNICNLNDKIRKTGNPMYFHHGFTSAIYRKELIDRYGFGFPEGISYNEDPYFAIMVASRLDSIRIVDGAKYYYRSVDYSLSRDLTQDKIEDLYRSVGGIFSYLEQCRVSVENKYIIADQAFALTSQLITEKKVSKELIIRLRQEYLAFLGISTSEKDVRISVIVPVYNGSRFLRRTLDCLTFQSMKEIEIICVNDRSTDDSLDILKEYRGEDARIKIIDCPVNGGESKARNMGIRAAAGEYIAFMDQDDRIDLAFYEKLYKRAVETGAEIVKGETREFYYGFAIAGQSYPIGKNPMYFAGEWWSAIYKRSLVVDNGLELPEGVPLGGDLKFLFDVCLACNKAATVHDVAYYHIMHPDSGDSEITPTVKIKSVIDILSYILNRIEEEHVFERDPECYIFYYVSYIEHVFSRIQRCNEPEGRIRCSDFVFRAFDACRSKGDVLSRLKVSAPLLAAVLKNNQKTFFEELFKQDSLNRVFYEAAYRNNSGSGDGQSRMLKDRSVACSVVVPFINEEQVKKYIVDNVFLKEEAGISYYFVDNRKNNKPISVVYNEFLDNYDYSEESWFVFMHSDFEFLEYPSHVLDQLDTSVIYGPVGARVYFNGEKMFSCGNGGVYEKPENSIMLENFAYLTEGTEVDTLDCMCMMVHSSLISNYSLRFDENTILDLYVEDFCINAHDKYGIPVEITKLKCVHHSSYCKERIFSKRYLKQLEYMNHKYPDKIYGGTVTPIGGKLLPSMSRREFYSYMIRQELLNGNKLLRPIREI